MNIDKLKDKISKEEFYEYYKNHNQEDTRKHFNLSYGSLHTLIKYYNIHKTKEELSNTQKKYTPKKEKLVEVLKDKISKEDLLNYYITENHSIKECEEYFCTKGITKLLRYYNIYKDSKLSNKRVCDVKEKKYGSRGYNNREKAKQTCIEKYGVENPAQNEEVKEKIKNTFLNNYSVEHPMKIKEIEQKVTNSIIKKYGVDRVAKLDSIRKQMQETYKQTCLDRYGVENAMQSPEQHKKFEESMLKNHGSTSMFSSNDFQPSYTNNSSYNQNFEKLLVENNLDYSKEFSVEGFRYDFKVGNILIEINPTITHNSTVSPFGTVKEKDYHYRKTKNAVDNGYRCINVWEWDNLEKIIQLLQKREKVFARKCIVKDVSVLECRDFLEKNHIQGYCKDNVRLGLYYHDELISVMTFGIPRYSKKYRYELLRYATIRNVIGGCNKLFYTFLERYREGNIISYCDFSKFLGTVYTKLGFRYCGYTIGKHWNNLKTKKHITDNLLRQRGFDQLLGNEYGCFGKGTDNEELMLTHNFLEVYDAGQGKYVYERNN